MRMDGLRIWTRIKPGHERKEAMPDARKIMDVYTGSSEPEQFDMWFSNRELRTQFNAIDHIQEIRGKEAPAGAGGPGSRRVPTAWRRLARWCPWPGHINSAGAKS